MHRVAQILRRAKAALLTAAVILLAGCAYITPIYLPKSTRNLYVDVMGHEPLNYKGVTASGVLAATEKELDFRKQEYLLKWEFTKQINHGLLVLAETTSNSVLGLMAGLGPVGALLAHKLGKNTKRDGDYSPEEVAKIKAEYESRLNTPAG